MTKTQREAQDERLAALSEVEVLDIVCPPMALLRRAPSVAIGALARWRAELVAGKRDAFQFDDLWRAACEEMNGGV